MLAKKEERTQLRSGELFKKVVKLNAKALGVNESDFIRIAVARFTLDYTNIEHKLTSKDREALINEFSDNTGDYIKKDYYESNGFENEAKTIKVKKRN